MEDSADVYQFKCYSHLKNTCRDFPGGPVVKNFPCNAGCMGSILSHRTKIPNAAEQ